ncbi:hypothetical protein Cyast_0647 [Cyanobacterium stanieri PCC 7202]|uniref:Uncharacterized protein n=1 Tax=Cyanobacterium stanieri (strain ATCC 29140 / PCC 7202) TaxID=292563 RepID=K9YKJ6_CYASC|nr:hypothetical protein Cyast_0647 [Cyanobacterium stanieri PCC 7202]
MIIIDLDHHNFMDIDFNINILGGVLISENIQNRKNEFLSASGILLGMATLTANASAQGSVGAITGVFVDSEVNTVNGLIVSSASSSSSSVATSQP